MIESLREFLIRSHDSGIYALARYIARHITANWEVVLQENSLEQSGLNSQLSDAAYGTYCRLLFEPVHEQLWHAGYRPRPRLPGNFSLSREWGSEPQRQRWFWSVIGSPGGGALGTIVIVFHHDHTQISIVRPPEVLPLEEITNESVISALSRRSVDFSNALEARIEIADGMRACALEQA